MLKKTLFALSACLVSAGTSTVAEEMSAAETFTFLLTHARPSSPAPYQTWPLEVSDDFQISIPKYPQGFYSVSVDDPCKPILELKDNENEVHLVLGFDMSNFVGLTRSKPGEPEGLWMEVSGDCPITWAGDCVPEDKGRFINLYEVLFSVPAHHSDQIPKDMMQELYEAADHYKASYCPA